MKSQMLGSKMDGAKVTVIMPTLCSKERSGSLKRAIDSLHEASSLPLKILVVINGQRADRRLRSELEARADIAVIQIAKGSAPLAQLEGRRLVQTDFFCFIDDDDEYLPGAIDLRLQHLLAAPSESLVVTNGYVNNSDGNYLLYNNLKNVPQDPLASLFDENWLSSCGALFRTQQVPISLFEDCVPYLEWTWLAFNICALGLNVGVIGTPTFTINKTENSASTTTDYLLFQEHLYKKMMRRTRRRDILAILRERLAHAWHAISVHYLKENQRALAWRAHLLSMGYVSGLKFLPYTRRLLT